MRFQEVSILAGIAHEARRVLGLVTLAVFGASKVSVRGLIYSVRRHRYSLGPYTS